MSDPVARKKWYADGLCFECTQCGNCCSGPPGHVWLTKTEIARISKFIGRKDGLLGKEHLRRTGFKYSLTEKPDGDCIFLKRNGRMSYCSIYEVRPRQCRTWPFWSGNLKSQAAWNATAKTCPGMGRGEHYSFLAIEELRVKKP